MSQEKVREIFSHVDMTKLDLSSFKISEKKFNELATIYRNRVILSCVSMIACKNNYDQESVDKAFAAIEKVAENPNLYTYATIYTNERRAVDEAINDIITRRDRNINDVKLKAIEKRMKDAYKQMRKTIEMALENGNSFEYEFDEATVERCLQIAKDAIDNGRQKVAEAHVAKANSMATQTELAQPASEVVCEEINISSTTNEQCETTPRTKASFWKRIFGKAQL